MNICFLPTWYFNNLLFNIREFIRLNERFVVSKVTYVYPIPRRIDISCVFRGNKVINYERVDYIKCLFTIFLKLRIYIKSNKTYS